MATLLEPPRHSAVRITLAVSNIDVSTVAAGDRIAAPPILITRPNLILRWKNSVRIAAPVSNIEIIAIGAFAVGKLHLVEKRCLRARTGCRGKDGKYD